MATRHRGRKVFRAPSRSCQIVADKLQAETEPGDGAFEVREYRTQEGRIPWRAWLKRIRDLQAIARIQHRVDRLHAGLLGDAESVGAGVVELRIHYGPGYRIYCGRDGSHLILLLCGGDKSSQSRDIGEAHAYWKDYKTHRPKRPA